MFDSRRLADALAERYRIERELGAGGMATVYLAEDLRHHRPVALKVLRPELSASLGAERFLREIEVMAALQHPHILGLYDSGQLDGLLFYVMPYVPGDTLRARLTREGQLPVGDAVRIARGVASALAFAHKQGIVHRDIKPENILLAEGEAMVADFGIARAVLEAGGTKLTSTGISVGTPTYMSPEQAAADKQIDGRSDVYSLGCVLYEMLAGDPPYGGATAQVITARKLTEPVRPLRGIRSSVPEALEEIIARALAVA
ncbi:MAG: serine/threonine-protein kinase, partial [Gemmatimonadota bacterium]|nr:serine/threonine-protein kinase [Gemmatimonadota bacterium]